jgi:L-asparaginase
LSSLATIIEYSIWHVKYFYLNFGLVRQWFIKIRHPKQIRELVLIEPQRYTFCMTIVFVQAGGTIDKNYPASDSHHGYYFDVGEASFLDILQRVNPDFSYRTITVLRKDSLDISEEERAQIAEAVNNIPQERIVITHGTDTIRKTAERLSEIKDKTIVLTGARLPERFYDSDAEFNVGMAVAGAPGLSRSPSALFATR